ncbi:MAG: cellulase family glycosylhydrolase [Tannerella sp.]|nr:cellulase family glycosylhydrolase [Tannerella sp.]
MFSQEREHAFEMNRRLGMGINFGNMFEAPSLGEWGVEPDSAYFRDVKSKGFASLRLPVKWSAHAMANYPYTIDGEFMDTIVWAVDLALKNELPVIINIHHYDEIMTNPAAHRERYLALWDQISTRFQNYSDSLYFEILNEPNGNFTPALWNQYLIEGLSKIREKNPDRMVLVGTADWGGIGGLSQLKLPDDPNIILTVHYYNPFNFTHQGADWTGQNLPVGVTWDSTAVQVKAIVDDMNVIKQYSEKNNVPVHIGEFGAIGNADDASRARWIGCLRTVFDENDFSGAYWEYCSGFGIYDPALDCYRTGLLRALTGYEGAYDCHAYDTVIVKNSAFNNSIQPWYFNQFPEYGATGNAKVVDGEARLEVLSPGSANWHIQFLYFSFTLKKGYTYTFLFDAYASTPVTIGAGIGKNYDDYRSFNYRDVNLTAEKKTFVSTFTFNEATENNSRIAFECGLINAQYLYFDNIHLYESAPGTAVEKVLFAECTVKIGGNRFAVEGAAVKSITVYDISGRIYHRKTYQPTQFVEIPENILPTHISLIQINTNAKNTVLKYVKR